MRLSNIVHNAIELNTLAGVTMQQKAAAAALSVAASDDEAIEDALQISIAKLVHDLSTKAMRKRPDDSRQGSLFLLHERYAIDAEARVIKDTEKLTQLEFQRIMALRQKQIEDDTRHYEMMVRAYNEVAPIWSEFPEKLFGEVEGIWLARRDAAE